MTDEKEQHMVTFTGYLAEVIRLQAEREEKTPQDYVISFFDARCNAPNPLPIVLKAKQSGMNFFTTKVQCTPLTRARRKQV